MTQYELNKLLEDAYNTGKSKGLFVSPEFNYSIEVTRLNKPKFDGEKIEGIIWDEFIEPPKECSKFIKQYRKTINKNK